MSNIRLVVNDYGNFFNLKNRKALVLSAENTSALRVGAVPRMPFCKKHKEFFRLDFLSQCCTAVDDVLY